MTTYMQSMLTVFYDMRNDIRNDVLSEVTNTLKNKNLLTKEIEDVLKEISGSTEKNKKSLVKKEKKPRFSGYHLFMKEHRVVVKNQNPGIKPQRLTTIVAKAWKHVSEVEKRELNERALRMKEAFYNNGDKEIVVEKKKEQKVNINKKIEKKIEKKVEKKKSIKKSPIKKEEELTKEYISELDSESEESDDSDDENEDTTDLSLVSESDDE